jgi:hypothetical protein
MVRPCAKSGQCLRIKFPSASIATGRGYDFFWTTTICCVQADRSVFRLVWISDLVKTLLHLLELPLQIADFAARTWALG